MRSLRRTRRGRTRSQPGGWRSRFSAESFPYWAVLLALIVGWLGWLSLFAERYRDAWDRIAVGIVFTIRATALAFAISLVLGLLLALGRISRNVVLRNVARTYIEFIRGVPMLPLIFFLALVVVPDAAGWLGFDNRSISTEWRGVIALAIIYGAYIAEVFRGGVQSVPRGQMEAGLSLGLSRRATLRRVIFPQAMRAVIPPLGNDFIAILKDSSLLSVLAVGEVTLRARQYAAGSFRFRESYVVLVFIYVSLVLVLSFALGRLERRLRGGEQSHDAHH